MTPVTLSYKLTAPFTSAGSYLPVSEGVVGPNGTTPLSTGAVGVDGVPVPAACQQFMAKNSFNLHPVLSCMTAHDYRGYVTYQPASRFWAFQGIETGIFLLLAAVLIGITFRVLRRRDA